MKAKLFFQFLLLILVSFSVSAYSFGTVNYDSEKVSEGNVSFRIDVLNPNNYSLLLEPSIQGLEKGNISFQSDRVIEPSEVTENPEGNNWVSIETGKYAKPESFHFNVVSNHQSGEDSFKIIIKAKKGKNRAQTEINQRVVQVREYSYKIKFAETDQQPTVERGFDSNELEQDDPDIIRRTDDEPEKNDLGPGKEDGGDFLNHSPLTKTNNTNSSSSVEKDSKSVNLTTLVLTIGLAGSLSYLWVIL